MWLCVSTREESSKYSSQWREAELNHTDPGSVHRHGNEKYDFHLTSQGGHTQQGKEQEEGEEHCDSLTTVTGS